MEFAPEEQTECSAIPLRSRPKTFCVARRPHELVVSDGSELVQSGKAMSSWVLMRFTGLSVMLYQVTEPEERPVIMTVESVYVNDRFDGETYQCRQIRM